jgi:hypothetical protein
MILLSTPLFSHWSIPLKDASNSKNAYQSLGASNSSDTSNNSTPATSNFKDDSNIMTAHNSRNESNDRTANTVWTPSEAGMFAKTVKPATAWREANSTVRFSP